MWHAAVGVACLDPNNADGYAWCAPVGVACLDPNNADGYAWCAAVGVACLDPNNTDFGSVYSADLLVWVAFPSLILLALATSIKQICHCHQCHL